MKSVKEALEKIRQQNEGIKISGLGSKTKLKIQSGVEIFIYGIAKTVELDKDKATADKLERYLKTVLKI